VWLHVCERAHACSCYGKLIGWLRTRFSLRQTPQVYTTVTEGVKLQDLQIGALQRKLDEGHGRLKQQQTLYDAVKADRATYKKNLMSAHAEISEMKRSFDGLKASIESVKDEITGKDAALVREHSEHARVDREKVGLIDHASILNAPTVTCIIQHAPFTR
jgi:hypothetical protein